MDDPQTTTYQATRREVHVEDIPPLLPCSAMRHGGSVMATQRVTTTSLDDGSQWVNELCQDCTLSVLATHAKFEKDEQRLLTRMARQTAPALAA